MNFADAIDELRTFVLIEKIAKALGVSEMNVRLMRGTGGASSMIPAPNGWEPQIAALAREQAHRLLHLADQLAPTTTNEAVPRPAAMSCRAPTQSYQFHRNSADRAGLQGCDG
jgi:hypothetical protein